MAKELTDAIIDACEASMPRKRRFRRSNPWWTKELTKRKKAVYRLRRGLQREREESAPRRKKLEYRSSLRRYSRAVRRAKLESWRRFVTSHGNSEPWGIAYKLQAEKFRTRDMLSTLRRSREESTMDARETASLLMEIYVPDDLENLDTPEQSVVREGARLAPTTEDSPPFTEQEVATVVKTLKNDKAPGPDIVEVRVIKATTKVIPGQLMRLHWGIFPRAWKVGSLRVFLKDEGKDEKDPKSYKPICLLSVIGRLFEKLIKSRLNWTSLTPEQVSARQFGFTSGLSTEKAIVELRRAVDASEQRYVVALLFDISGVFDNVWWLLVLKSLRDRRSPRNVFEVMVSYFSDHVGWSSN